MRVIAGTAKGRRLETPLGNKTRPTGEKAKEALFSALQFELYGKTFADIFAGSGQMGIEALSRGAERAVFVDLDKTAVSLIEKNIKTCGFENKAHVYCSDYKSFFSRTNEKFDIIFIDPPYKAALYEDAVLKAQGVASENGRIFVEYEKGTTLSEKIGSFVLTKTYCYGREQINVYSGSEEE